MKIRTARIETDLPAITRITNPYEIQPITVEQVRNWFQYNPPGRIQLRLVAVNEEDAVIGYSGFVYEVSMPAHHFVVWVVVDQNYHRQGIGSALWDATLERLQEYEPIRLDCDVLDHDPVGLTFAEQRGFTIDRHHYPSILDLSAFDEAPFLPDIAALEADGIRFCSLADFPDTPETLHKFYKLNLSVVMDIPGENWDYDAYPQFFKDRILGASWFKPENQLLAVDGDIWAGFASVKLNPESQSAYNATTGVIRAYRGRKIALALKIMAARYACQHGAWQINTDNDSLNAPILAVNKKMGYQPQPGQYFLIRWLEDKESQG